MSRLQGYHLIGVVWLVLASVNRPHDMGTVLSAATGLVFIVAALFSMKDHA